MIAWRYRFGPRPLEQYRLELGLYRLNEGHGSRWRATPLVEQFRSLISRTEEAVGPLDHPKFRYAP
jgi:hypothetical protein